MFRQMAHLKCLRRGISNFNETLDSAYELFISSRREKKNLKAKIQQFAEKLTFSNWDGRRMYKYKFY